MDRQDQRPEDIRIPGSSIPSQGHPPSARNGQRQQDHSDPFGIDFSSTSATDNARGRAPTLPSPFRPSYQRVAEDSPSPPLFGRDRVPQIIVPSNDDGFFQDEHLSPADPAAAAQLQEAMGGLSFGDGSTSGFHDNWTPTESRTRATSAHSNLSGLNGSEAKDYFSAEPEDTPLNKTRSAQYATGLSPAGLARSSMQSVRLSPGARSGMGRLGDELRFGSEGWRSRQPSTLSPRMGSARSGSPGASTLDRANSMLRQMSQRVVNLSNEPEAVATTLQRQPSSHSQRDPSPERQEDFPMATSYSNGSFIHPNVVSEKAPSVSVMPDKGYGTQMNPLKGRTLGIFGPENPLRLFLCEILVHPITEPFILVLIIFQVVLLSLDSYKSVYDDPRSTAWSTHSWTDWAVLGLFILYTLELSARIVVSGFILNPNEYSTINRHEKGFWKGIIARGEGLLNIQRRDALNPNMPDPYDAYAPADQRAGFDHSKKRQRVSLARRAFLRHSFSRLDFLAVVSFWIAFSLSLTGVQTAAHLYVFQMMSCLRILRLLGITRGTSVSAQQIVDAMAPDTNIFVGNSSQLEKGSAFARPGCDPDAVLLAALRHHRSAKLQVEPQTSVRLVRLPRRTTELCTASRLLRRSVG